MTARSNYNLILRYFVIVLLCLPLISFGLETPKDEQSFIARTILSRAVDFNLPPKTMLGIALCESSLNPRAKNFNKNNTTDRGVFQLNSVHNARLNQMGLNPYNYLDNINYALFLAQTEGLQHWNATLKCAKSSDTQKKIALLDT